MRLDFVKIFVDSTILLFKELVGPSVDVPSISMKASPVAGREVMAIIGLAHNLNLKVIAEGVETEEQLAFLRLLKCDEIQGYLNCQPLAAAAFKQFVDGFQNDAADGK